MKTTTRRQQQLPSSPSTRLPQQLSRPSPATVAHQHHHLRRPRSLPTSFAPSSTDAPMLSSSSTSSAAASDFHLKLIRVSYRASPHRDKPPRRSTPPTPPNFAQCSPAIRWPCVPLVLQSRRFCATIASPLCATTIYVRAHASCIAISADRCVRINHLSTTISREYDDSRTTI